MNKSKSINNRILFLIICSFITGVLLFIDPSIISGKIAYSVLLLLSCSPIYFTWKQKDTVFLIIYIFMALYILPPIKYYWNGEDITFWRTECQTEDTVYQTILTLMVFYIGIIWGQWQKGKIERIKQYKPLFLLNNNTRGFLVCIGLAMICIIYGKSGETIVDSGGYGKSQMEVSSLYGYGIIPILIGLQYSNTRFKRNLIFIISSLYIIKDFLYGGRVDSIQLCLGLFILYFCKKWTMKKTILISCGAFAVMTIWGIFRSAVNDGIIIAYQKFISNMSGDGNTNDVFYSSMRVIYLMDEGLLSLSMRFEALLGFTGSIVLPYSWLPPIANLSSWNQAIVSSGGGGLFPVFTMIMVGWGGLFIISYILGLCFRKFQHDNGSNFFKFWIILVIATCPRWYAYYPISICKLALYGSLLYVILNHLFPNKTKIAL